MDISRSAHVIHADKAIEILAFLLPVAREHSRLKYYVSRKSIRTLALISAVSAVYRQIKRNILPYRHLVHNVTSGLMRFGLKCKWVWMPKHSAWHQIHHKV